MNRRNSSVAIRECSFLGVPAVNIGTRQQGRERGNNVIDVGYDDELIAEAILTNWSRKHCPQDFTYGDGHSGEKIAELLASVTPGIEKRLTYSYE